MKSKAASIVTTVVFVVVLFTLSVANLFSPVSTFSENENRVLATMPEFSWEDLTSGKFGDDFNSFLSDQFIARDQWVSIKTATELALQEKEINGVLFCKDNYMMEHHDTVDIDQALLNLNTQRLQNFLTQYSNQLGTQHVKAMILPTASEVLTDKLPQYVPLFDQSAAIEKIEQGCPDGTFINMVPVLQEHKDEYIYYRTDHHWTTYGAFLSYGEWAASSGITPLQASDFNIKTVSNSFLGTVYSKANYYAALPDSISIYEPKEPHTYSLVFNQGDKTSDSLYQFDYLDKKDKYSMFLDGNNPLVDIQTDVKNGKRLLVIKDSFAHCFVPFLANHFEEIVMVDFRYYNDGVSSLFDQTEFTDVLVLYNLINFGEDSRISNLER